MKWDDLLAQRQWRDDDGNLNRLEEVDDDDGFAVYRRNGTSHDVRRPRAVDPRGFEPRSEFAVELRAFDAEVVEDEAPAAPSRARLVAAGVAAAGLAWLATRRRG
ncbi:hypothetical protein DVA67_014225 [Solirubrobacter sp. CPCC 204708]|uniref:PGF-CTERM sorting domain-containing protein n=1 Tax=Solirubrobacter deserti TaxID=2282478 RepID=A0ABT4RBR7_9ACTN|nr:hypothetical protein [Solirubrobacter deserti]MBE2317134.1 hypothetical protein [Solirubrobacter deserti]MDA0135973.1 hypothetical protein [Solirubrobacter deserti]